MTLLLTGFTPFQGAEVNPSQLIIELIHHDDVVARVLPTEYDAAGARLLELLDDVRPSVVVCLGVAQSRTNIGLERVALNLDDASIPDNAEVLRRGQPIVTDAPLAYLSSLPLDALRDAIAARSIPVAISNHAGTFVCNHVFYTARHALERRGINIPCGFIHVPKLLDADGTGMTLDMMVEAVEACLDVLRETAAANYSSLEMQTR